MIRRFSFGILIISFSLSSVNVSLASDIIDVSPVVVQPYDLGPMNHVNKGNQERLSTIEGRDLGTLNQTDRENQEKALALEGLIKEHERQMAKASGSNIPPSARLDGGQSIVSTIDYTQDPILERYKVLTELEDEMQALNTKISTAESNEDLQATSHQQEGTIRELNKRLDEGEERINHDEDTLAQKDRQITELKDSLAETLNETIVNGKSAKVQKDQMDLLKSELENKITESKTSASELKAKDETIRWLNQKLDVAKKQAQYYQLSSQQDNLATQQIQKEVQDLKSDFAQHFKDYDQFENTINSLKGQVSQLQEQLSQKQSQVDLLKLELKNKISQGGDQAVLEADTLKQQLVGEKDRIGQLKQQLEMKSAQSDQLSLMVDAYQKKLEDRNNINNDQLKQIMSDKNYQAQMDKQIAYLSTQVQEKEGLIVKIKKAMYDLQQQNDASQAKDLNSFLGQQKTMSKEIQRLKTELELATRGHGVPVPGSSDELNFLRTAYKQVAAELEQKSKMLGEAKANAAEYEKAYKEQSKGFQSLKEQLRDAQRELKLKDAQLMHKGDGNKAVLLQEQLDKAKVEIKDLQTQLKQFEASSQHNALQDKLKQALDKIDQQGRSISILNQKVQDCGQSADLTKTSK